jgi:hypothetical protein
MRRASPSGIAASLPKAPDLTPRADGGCSRRSAAERRGASSRCLRLARQAVVSTLARVATGKDDTRASGPAPARRLPATTSRRVGRAFSSSTVCGRRACRSSRGPCGDAGNNPCREGKPFSYPELRARGEALRRADVRRRPGRLRAGELEVDAGRAWCACGARRSSCPIRSSRSCARWRRTPPVCSPRISCCARSGAFTRWAVTVAKLHIADRARRPNPRRTRRCRYRLAWIGAVPLCGPGVLGPCRQEPLPRAHHVSSRYRCARLA